MRLFATMDLVIKEALVQGASWDASGRVTIQDPVVSAIRGIAA